MPASLRTLPPEILLLIISNVKKTGWLLDLALCCRSLYHSTLPYLYSHIKLLFPTHENKTREPYLKSFTLHILKHPELAALVHGFTMNQSWQDTYNCSENTRSPGIDEAIQQVILRSHRFQGDLDEWIWHLTRGDVGSYLTVLLSSLPNLECLDLVLPRQSACYFEGLLHRAVKGNLLNTHSAFSSLRVINHDCRGHGYGASAGLLSDYLHLPSLHELSCRKIGSYNNRANEGLATLGPATIPLVHLELREGRLNDPDLANVLRACKGLKSFVYEVGRDAYFFYDCKTPALAQVLKWIENSVEDLWLDHVGDAYSRLGDGDLPPVSAFSSLKVLKNLRVGMYLFLDILRGDTSWIGPVLPASIETLYFTHTTGEVTELTSTLERLLQTKESCAPNLRRITFEVDIREKDKALEHSRLDFLAKEADVDIEKN